MEAGITRSGRVGLALITVAALIFAMLAISSWDPARAEHDPHDDEVANDGPAGTNDAPYWVSYLSTVRGIDGASCEKIAQDGDDAFVMPAEPDGEDWVLLVVKQADTNWVFYDPIAGHAYPSVGDNAPGFSHIIVCSVAEPVEDTTTTTVEDTTTTTVADTTTTTLADTTTTVQVQQTTITAAATTTSSIEDEVLAEEILPFTGSESGPLAIVASILALLGSLLVWSARRAET